MLQNWYNQKQEGSTWLYQKTFQRAYKGLQRKINLPTVCQTWWRQCCDMGMRADQWNKATSVY